MPSSCETKCQKKILCRSGLATPSARLNGNSPAQQYQKLKIIQKSVRVPASVYTMNLGALTTYQEPLNGYLDVNWNQMSDRKVPHEQSQGASGVNPTNRHSTKGKKPRLQPGALSPGGVGVDIKHNSYERYLNRLKGGKTLKQQKAPANFGKPIKFNEARPIYGGKVMKTGIVAGCTCDNSPRNPSLYKDIIRQELNVVLFDPSCFVDDRNCLCRELTEPPKNQFYGYTESDSFILQCAQDAQCGDIIPIL